MTSSKTDRTPEEVAVDVALKKADLEEKKATLRKARAEAVEAECKAKSAQMDLDKKREDDLARRAADNHHHIYNFIGAVGDKTVQDCMSTLTRWSRTSPKCEMEIVFNSPGGSVTDGMALFDFIQDLRQKGHKVTTSARGIAASMAGILLQAGDVRRMGKESWVLIHQASFGASGTFGTVEDQVEWVRKIQERILDIFVSRSSMTKQYVRKNWERKNWWLSSDECLKLGIVDEVI